MFLWNLKIFYIPPPQEGDYFILIELDDRWRGNADRYNRERDLLLRHWGVYGRRERVSWWIKKWGGEVQRRVMRRGISSEKSRGMDEMVLDGGTSHSRLLNSYFQREKWREWFCYSVGEGLFSFVIRKTSLSHPLPSSPLNLIWERGSLEFPQSDLHK